MRARCGECDACRREDCGTCRFCLRKKKFGGDGNCKTCCEMRRCTNLQERKSVGKRSASTPLTETPKEDSRKPAPPTSETSSFTTSSPSPRKKRAKGNLKAPPASAAQQKQPGRHMYGKPLPERVTDVCAGCLGKRNEELKDDAILLCDGEGCGREYHMTCCLPQLFEVPDGPYYCIDCDRDGSTAHLQAYFDRSTEKRANYETSKAFVESLLKKELPREDNVKEPRIPRSELDRISEAHRDVSSKPGAPAAMTALGPDFLVGKSVQLYSSLDNQYHTGRILDWRQANHLAPLSSSTVEDDDAFHGSTEISKCEFLVSFPAGIEYRKTTLHQWIILEEHCLAVAIDLIWGEMNKKKGIAGFAPAQTWLRTSLELIPVLSQLSESLGQIFYTDRPEPDSSKSVWALTQLFGEEAHALLPLPSESVDFFDESFSTQRLAKLSSPSKSSGTLERHEVPMALVFAEAEEQKRVRKWYAMPLRNPVHRKALTIANESSLTSIETAPRKIDKTLPKPCQLISHGLDRMYIMELLESQGVEMSKDTAASITCRRVESMTSAIQQLTDA